MSGLMLVDVTVGYTRAPVLHSVNLEVGSDEIVGLLGANGSGKTTLLRTVIGVLRPWSGEISFEGARLGRSSPWHRARTGIGHVPEGRHVFSAMTVQENLDVAGLVAPSPRDRRDRVFTLFPRLAERRRQRAGSLSGGEQQMLAIGRALMTNPRLLLVDEMSAGLAPVVAQQLVEGLVAIHHDGVGILIVEQNPQLISDIVTRVYLLERGGIVASGELNAIGGVDAVADRYLGVEARKTPTSP